MSQEPIEENLMNEPQKSSLPYRHLYRRRSLTTVLGLLVLLASGFTGQCAPPFQDSALETYELEVISDASRILPLLQRPDEPFVMANLLVFKDMATGEGFEGLTGAEAYQIYSEGLTEIQAALGSRFIWAGAVRQQVVGSSDPVFETLALLEYASPTAFLTLAGNPGEAPEARIAGLLGQWAVASTSLEEPDPSPSASAERGEGRPFGGPPGVCREGRHVPSRKPTTVSGLSLEQICRLLEGPAHEPVFIVELLRFADGSGELYQPYREAIAAANQETGGELIWRGSLDTYVLGNASPSFDEMVVTRYPNPRAYLLTLRRPDVLAASPSRAQGLELHWLYTADEVIDSFGS
jgi:uncharacterized protein (DUF1330 family)